MSPAIHSQLSRRERQIMEVIYRRKGATVAEVLREMPDPPSYSAVRTTMNILERKGYLNHARRGKQYYYTPRTPHRRAMQGAIRHLLATYFDNSLEKAVTAMVSLHSKDLTPADIDRLERIIRNQRE